MPLNYLVNSRRPRWDTLGEDNRASGALAASLRSLAQEKLAQSPGPGEFKLYKTLLNLPLHILAALLLNRGVDSGQAALDFLRPDPTGFHPWQLLPEAEKAVDRLNLARQRREKIMIHGDYDADGITATALLVLALRDLGLEVSFYLPHRQEDGYGLSQTGIAWGAEEGCTVLLTVDCGISDPEETEYAKNLGMDVIITDHHLPPDRLPAALAVVNPKRVDSQYPFPELAGVGVAWKLAGALPLSAECQGACLQLAALGTVADMVPLVGENRILVSLGLAEMNSRPLPGIATLAEVAGLQPGHLDSQDIAFGLAPRLNAVGRMDSAQPAAALLLAGDLGTASQHAIRLDEENRLRRRTEQEILGLALVQAEEQIRLGRRMLMVHGRDWHPGVLGIVAAKILDRYCRPTIVLSGEDELTGSARSVAGFDIHAALTHASSLLHSYGGHAGAAGLELAAANLTPLGEVLEEYALANNLDSLLQPVIQLEGRLGSEDISMALVDTIALLRPFGFGNPEPVFAVEGFTVGTPSLAGADKKHLRLRLDKSGTGENLWAIGFNKAHLLHGLDPGGEMELAGVLHLNRWQGLTRVQLQIADLRGPQRLTLGGRELVDRREQGEPWLTALAQGPDTVFIANTYWRARRLLAERLPNCRVIILPPDKCREKVYNLEAREVAFLDPAWNDKQLKECIRLLPPGCRLHFFGGGLPQEVLQPSLNLLRFFYRQWRQNKGEKDLLRLLPAELAEPLLLERALLIFAEAGLVGKGEQGWELKCFRGNTDLTLTRAWQEAGSQLAAYQEWLEGFAARNIATLLA